jgi:hypothetical protein
VAVGHYYLVQEAQGLGGTTCLPAADVDSAVVGVPINLSATSGKVALVANTTPLTGGCPTGTVDLLGYGSASCFEGSPIGSLSNTTAAVRRDNGCQDTDDNQLDFLPPAGPPPVGPIPRNSLSPLNSCGGDPAQPSGFGLASPNTVLAGGTSSLTVTVTPADDPPSTGITVTANLTEIGGSASQPFNDDGGNVFSFHPTVGGSIPPGVKNIVATITDAEGRGATAPITMTAKGPTCGAERWPVKTGTDQDVGNVDVDNLVDTTIAYLGALPTPKPPYPENGRVDSPSGEAVETTVYVINAMMTKYRGEPGDSDYHIIIEDGAGNTMIVEIPFPGDAQFPPPGCLGRCSATSRFNDDIANARVEFDDRYAPVPYDHFVVLDDPVPVQVIGVGFFDLIHGQTGVAPNGIELHPVLDITFLDGGRPPRPRRLGHNGQATFNTSALSPSLGSLGYELRYSVWSSHKLRQNRAPQWGWLSGDASVASW